MPSGGTARAIAHAYSVFATDGRELGLRAIQPTRGFYDECVRGEVQFSLGFMNPNASSPFGGVSSSGSPGAGGSMGFADPTAGIGYAYVMSQMGHRLLEIRGMLAHRDALYCAVPARTNLPA